jgi:hypothetical protein
MTKTERLVKLAASQRAVALSLWSEPCERAAQQSDRTCEAVEEARPLEDGSPRGFHEFDSERMCASCRSHWHAEMAARTLESAAQIGKRMTARLARTRAPEFEEGVDAPPAQIASRRR